MATWISRLFRSRTESLAEKAEVEGRYEDAARLFVESGSRQDAYRVLVRASEATVDLTQRRALLGRAYTVAPTDGERAAAKSGLAGVTLAECESQPPRTEEARQRLVEAAADFEGAAMFEHAARAYRLLGDRASVERVLVLAGDVDGFEKEAGAEHEEERYRLRRRNSIESFESLWRSGDRVAALDGLGTWARANEADLEARRLLDDRAAQLVKSSRFEARLGDLGLVVVGEFPATFGREGHVVVRGASVSREHCVVEREADGAFVVRDNGSRNGTQVRGLPLEGRIPLAAAETIGLGADLTLRVRSTDDANTVLEIDRGMDRGKRIVLVAKSWPLPFGTLRFEQGRAVLVPSQAVMLAGQKIIAPIALARGDRVEAAGQSLEITR